MTSDYGAEIAQQGIDVSVASDDQKVLDTRWITLDIVEEPSYEFSGSLTTTSVSGGTGFSNVALIAYQHNLGFLPAFEYEILSATVVGGISGFASYDMFADATYIYLVPTIGATVSSVTLTIALNMRIYNLPITEEYQAPNVLGTPVTSNSPSDYGIKFLSAGRVGADIRTAAPEDLSFSTGMRPLNILQHGVTTIPGTFGNITITYDYNNPPLYVVGVYLPTGVNQATTGARATIPGPVVGSLNFSGSRGTITDDTITIGGTQAALRGSFTYILFKDPLNIKS